MMNSEQIKNEIEYGFSKLKNAEKCVAILGSARIKPEHRYYKLTEEIARCVSQMGFSILTGGGPGIMEAGNKGAFIQGGKSIGLNISLPFEQTHNDYISTNFQLNFEHFFTRKLMIAQHSVAYIVMPGGFGTLDELFDIITLIQTQKIPKAPIILVGSDFWQGLLNWFKILLSENLILEENLNLISLVDSPEEVTKYLQKLH